MGSCCSCCQDTSDSDSSDGESPKVIVDTVLIGRRNESGAYHCIVFFPSMPPMNAVLRFRNVAHPRALLPGDSVRITGLYELTAAGEYLVDLA